MTKQIFNWMIIIFLLPSLGWPLLVFNEQEPNLTPPPMKNSLEADSQRFDNSIPRLNPGVFGGALPFVPNVGQNDPAVRFQAHPMGGAIFFTPAEVVLSLPGTAAQSAYAGPTPAIVRMRFEGANPAPEIVETRQLPGVVNYFLGDDSTQWRTNLPTYSGIVYQQLYDGIDLRYEGTMTALKGTYLVGPGIAPAQIRWRYEGAQQVQIDPATGDLMISLDKKGEEELFTLSEKAPTAWQDLDGRRIPVDVRYQVAVDGTVSFITGLYDPTQPLTIDPYLVYSTLIGGSEGEEGRDIALDSAGNVYLTGSTLSPNFPNAGPPQATYGGPSSGNFGDAFIAKLNPAGDALLYMTYLGGSIADIGDAITVDSQGNAYVTGMTESDNFPTTPNAYQENRVPQNCSTPPCADAFVAKLNAAGNALVFSTYLGGSKEENIHLLDVGTRGGALGIDVDSGGNIYVTGITDSDNFPPVNAAFSNHSGLSDIFITKLRPDGQELLYSTYLGGTGADYSGDIAVDNTGKAHVTGYTLSGNFPTKNALQNTNASPGIAEVIIAKFDTTQSGPNSFLYSTYLGDARADHGMGIALDNSGNVYLAGHTLSLNFPTQNAFQATNASAGQANPYEAFVAKLNSTGSALLYSTYLGGSSYDVGYDLDIDAQGNIYLTGVTTSDDFPIQDPWQQDRADFRDIFVTKLDPTQSGAASLIYSTYFGSPLNDYSYGIAVDGDSNPYITGIGSGVVVKDFPIYTEIGPHDTGDGVLVAKFGPPPPPPTLKYIYLPLVIK